MVGWSCFCAEREPAQAAVRKSADAAEGRGGLARPGTRGQLAPDRRRRRRALQLPPELSEDATDWHTGPPCCGRDRGVAFEAFFAPLRAAPDAEPSRDPGRLRASGLAGRGFDVSGPDTGDRARSTSASAARPRRSISGTGCRASRSADPGGVGAGTGPPRRRPTAASPSCDAPQAPAQLSSPQAAAGGAVRAADPAASSRSLAFRRRRARPTGARDRAPGTSAPGLSPRSVTVSRACGWAAYPRASGFYPVIRAVVQ